MAFFTVGEEEVTPTTKDNVALDIMMMLNFLR
jgi:hypothetical protein